MMETYLYSNPHDGGQSQLVRMSLQSAGIKFMEINPYSLMPENRQLIKHRLSCTPTVVFESGGKEIGRVEHRLEKTGPLSKEMMKKHIINENTLKLIKRAKQQSAMDMYAERTRAVALGFNDVVDEIQGSIDSKLVEIDRIQGLIDFEPKEMEL